MKIARIFLLVTVSILLSVASVTADNGMAISPEICLGCHDDVVSAVAYGRSVHGQNACTSCHVEVTSLDAHTSGDLMPSPPKCVRCHTKEAKEHFSSVHMLNDITCADCHDDVHVHNYWKGDKTKVIAKCTNCHDNHEDYSESVHGKAVLAGNADSAACSDCHGLHQIDAIGDPGSRANREFHTRICLTCHADQEMMDRNGVFNVAVSTYMESYHGKNYRLGFPENVAGCADCHGSHNVLPQDDPKSTVNSENLVTTCTPCHPGATGLFTMFYSHGDMMDSENYPIMYWTFFAMTGLLIGTFAVFWVHTLLWMVRGFIENRQTLAALHAGGA